MSSKQLAKTFKQLTCISLKSGFDKKSTSFSKPPISLNDSRFSAIYQKINFLMIKLYEVN